MVILYCCICILGAGAVLWQDWLRALVAEAVESMDEALDLRIVWENITRARRLRVFALRTSLEAVHCTKNENVCLSYDFTKLKLDIANTESSRVSLHLAWLKTPVPEPPFAPGGYPVPPRFMSECSLARVLLELHRLTGHKSEFQFLLQTHRRV